MNRASSVLARLVCAVVFGPVDRTVCRFQRFYAEELAATRATP